MKKPKIDWIIHCCRNGVACAECGDIESGFIENTCNAHTHGMQRYGHMDFQMVIQYSDDNICRILNTFGLWVQEGKKFKDGDVVSGIFEDCDVKLKEFLESDRKVLRIIIPDKNNVFPDEEGCLSPYIFQLFSTEMLSSKGGVRA